MKVIIQIPCYNEEETLPQTIKDLPTQIEGIDSVEFLIIDDGSSDKTVEVARKLGVHHIIKNINNKGLARTFLIGLDACLSLQADIIVNTDGDNQYCGRDIPRLIEPILKQQADIVIGDRQTDTTPHFSFMKKKLQKLGSWIIRHVSDTTVRDAVSGFRAFSREAALQINIVSPFSYTIESIIQAGKKHLAVTSVPIGTNPQTRESRLFKSIPSFIERSVTTMMRTYTMYQPLRVFFMIGSLLVIGGLIPSIRFLIYFFSGSGTGHIQSLVLAAILFIVGFQVLVVGLVADIISFNRRLIEEMLLRVRRMELNHQESRLDK